jgi:hypothetical protein
MVVVFLICVQFDLDLSFSSCLRRLELGPLAGFISVAPSVSQSPPARFSLGSFSVLAGSRSALVSFGFSACGRSWTSLHFELLLATCSFGLCARFPAWFLFLSSFILLP